MKTIETLDPKPFRRLCMTIGELPTSYLDSMTYYEMVAWLCEYIKKNVVTAINDHAAAIAEIQQWIETLDLQDEVDNKIDRMKESGELAEIITQYLEIHGILAFDSVADMKDAENLVDGSFVETYGFYTKGDGGGSKYKVREVTNADTVDEATIIALNDENLVAELMFDHKMHIMQFGLSENNDVTTIFQKIITNMAGGKLVINDTTINLTNTITLPDSIEIEGNGLIKYSGDIDFVFANDSDTDDKTIKIDGLRFEKFGNLFSNLNRIIYVSGGKLTVNRCSFKNFVTAIHHNLGDSFVCTNNYFENVLGEADHYGYGINSSSIYQEITNNTFVNETTTYGRHAIYINGSIVTNVRVEHLYVKNWQHNPIQINTSNTTRPTIVLEDIELIDTCFTNPGSSPNANIGAINVSQDSYGLVFVNNLIAKGLVTNAILNMSDNSTFRISNIDLNHNVSLNDQKMSIYLRYGSGHTITNAFVDTTIDTAHNAIIYVRNTDCIINNVVTKGTYGTSLVTSNSSTVKLGSYDTTLTVASTIGTGTVAKLDYFDNPSA